MLLTNHKKCASIIKLEGGWAGTWLSIYISNKEHRGYIASYETEALYGR